MSTGSPTFAKTIGIVRVTVVLDTMDPRSTAAVAAPPPVTMVGSQAHQLLRERSYPIDVNAAPPKVHLHVAAIGPTEVRKRLSERRDGRLVHGIVFVAPHEYADAPHAFALLCLRR
jgi:hypothetical protein